MTDNNQLTALLLQHHGELFGFVRALVHNTQAAEDVFQNVAMAILKAAERDIEVENFQAWSKEVARRQVYKYFRDNKRQRPAAVPVDEMQELVGSAMLSYNPDYATRLSEQEALRVCLSGLTEIARKAVTMRFHASHSYEEIATALKKKEATVRQITSRARKALFECLAGKTIAAC